MVNIITKSSKRYAAQALAVVMIVLVVAMVIGMAIYSRTLRDRERVMNEQASAEALELTDSILEVTRGTPLETFETVCSNPVYGEGLTSQSGCTVMGASNVKTFLEATGNSSSFVDNFASCSASGSQVGLQIGYANYDDDYEIRPDAVRSFVVRQQTPSPTSCTLDLEFEPRASQNAGVSISKVFATSYDSNGNPETYKPYEYADTTQYCLYNSGGTCPDADVLTGVWQPLSTSTTLSIPLNEANLDEIRVRAVNAPVGMKFRLSSNQCVQDLEMIKIVVSATCNGSWRAKEIQVPQQEWSLPLFDYVLFNGNGAL